MNRDEHGKPAGDGREDSGTRWPWWGQFLLAVIALAAACALLIWFPIRAVQEFSGEDAKDTILAWGPMFAAFAGLTAMTVSGVFIFMTFRIDRGARLAAKKEAEEVAEKVAKEKAEEIAKKAEEIAKTETKKAAEEKIKESVGDIEQFILREMSHWTTNFRVKEGVARHHAEAATKAIDDVKKRLMGEETDFRAFVGKTKGDVEETKAETQKIIMDAGTDSTRQIKAIEREETGRIEQAGEWAEGQVRNRTEQAKAGIEETEGRAKAGVRQESEKARSGVGQAGEEARGEVKQAGEEARGEVKRAGEEARSEVKRAGEDAGGKVKQAREGAREEIDNIKKETARSLNENETRIVDRMHKEVGRIVDDARKRVAEADIDKVAEAAVRRVIAERRGRFPWFPRPDRS